ncbi:hydrogenase nickel incorporation protein HypB [Nodularia spumigena CS-584]|jgi:hydrogenase nickel incorporation protein HypB|uniref:Hydrogenase isoenzymes nickel incorporation protein HypB n=1 Tax=Nodularia spumigena UHCC 0039 TaxID=1914872 RepID=A0A2S0QAH6_NODSP|nr:hydrogenase nickel incorporation protein HypB [Nodularia spumigena]AHJ30423.1 [NiFe] hydrogenase nickel incorporation-associated protein HypB [Nodularia spumigena CCY9414]AVZ31364.1 hydrogenase isoenzymes nickel incorporation protein HypB [Nodularia spumigena UHCC 0039]EAW46964.1 Hydrogenase accessory protein HypB [Nodularia spumigena CCY9414]MDB9383426.1 hydrogenase nickel incorporation protein HypB [Nodularia spumigena CS-584]
MCVTCGCSDDAESTITNLETGEVEHNHHDHTHTLLDGTVISHSHNHDTQHEASQVHAKIHNTTISLEQDILAKNNLIAAQNRGWFKGRNILALNLMSSPGSGKTTLLTRTIHDLKSQLPISVIEGDQETANDAQKIQETGCKVVQINTGTGCHLEAAMIDRGLQQLNPPLNSVVMIENVGNLVCPALFDLGEQAKVVILSVTEGEDKPIKYPHMFRASEIMILTKVDLLPYVQFDVQKCIDYARQVNPQIQIFQVSATTGAGLETWYGWLSATVGNLSTPVSV